MNEYSINVAVQHEARGTWTHEYRIFLPAGTSRETAIKMRQEYRTAFPAKMVDLYCKVETNRQVR